jgi:hypothetical protein
MTFSAIIVLLVKAGGTAIALAGNTFVTAELAIVNAAKVPAAAFCNSRMGLAAFGTISVRDHFVYRHRTEQETRMMRCRYFRIQHRDEVDITFNMVSYVLGP